MGLLHKPAILLATLISCCSLLVNSPEVAYSADFAKGVEAYKNRDYETALQELTPLAQRGDVKAQFYLGSAYSARKLSASDQKEAIKWFTKAAEKKDAFSQYTLGQMYSLEKSQLKDYVKSYAWFNLALSRGNETARKGRDSVMMKMTPKQISEGRAFYQELHKKIYAK